jgi:hypothetical protein
VAIARLEICEHTARLHSPKTPCLPC